MSPKILKNFVKPWSPIRPEFEELTLEILKSAQFFRFISFFHPKTSRKKSTLSVEEPVLDASTAK
jgi:hypothetical protein